MSTSKVIIDRINTQLISCRDDNKVDKVSIRTRQGKKGWSLIFVITSFLKEESKVHVKCTMSKFAFTCKVFGGNLVVSTDEYYKFNFFFILRW